MNHLKNKPILFEFKGTVSKTCRGYLLRKLSVRTFVTASIMLIVAGMITIFAVGAMMNGEIETWMLWFIPAIAVVAFLFSGLCAALLYTKKEQAEIFAERICFYDDEDNTVVIEYAKEQKVEYSDLFRKILDMGDYYIIDIPARSGRGIVCEKALMTHGTPEEFDAKFAEKIQRKDMELK